RQRRTPGSVRRIIRGAWPLIVVPCVSYVAWQVYIRLELPKVPGAPQVAATGPPAGSITGFPDRLAPVLHGVAGVVSTWELIYVGLMLVAMLAAIVLVRRGSAAAMAALMFAAILTVVQFTDQWVLTRYSAPLFGALLIAGLDQRSRPVKAVCAAAGAMSIFLPWVIVGT
ncbi:MAG: hypothetical protein ACRDLV_11800, partial [Solirubrobacteraceae bacterium]